jgi:hypothetical protein
MSLAPDVLAGDSPLTGCDAKSSLVAIYEPKPHNTRGSLPIRKVNQFGASFQKQIAAGG